MTGRVEHRFGGRPDLILGGEDVARAQLTAQVKEDLTRAELLAFPLLALLCVLIFRGLAAILPLIVALLSVTSTFTLLRVVDEVVAVSPFALNLVLALGLGLSVDFSLLMVSRFREEAGRRPVIDAVVGTMSSAGRAVAYSAMTVALALSVLAVFPQRFMVSMAIGGVLVALCAALSALVVIPALLARFGPHVQTRSAPPARGRWYDFAHAVMRRPLAVALATTAVLLLLAAPALRAAWTGIDAGALPTERSARTLQDSVAAGFATDETPLAVVVKAPGERKPGRR
ncbi:MMPL family transporter [Svornostia abyssi]|uniref:MMPL family transporter n=1 Tax=Svornostia abyssi TaxID=2898438 RepID=UPI00338E2700